ncbi:MAG: hypothetical protein ABI811_18175 [Acidobacteriota bacterium]
MKRTLRNALGYFLLFMAVVGALLPLLQGWIFFAAAVGVLGTEHWAIKWCLKQLQLYKVVLHWLRVKLQRFGIGMPKDYPPGGPPSAP